MSTGTKKRSAKQSYIRAAALKLFASQGYDRTSLKDIADELGLTHPALYYYYQSKDELLFDAVLYSMQALLDRLQEKLSECEGRPFRDRICALAQEQVLFQLDVKGITPLVDSVLFGSFSQLKLFTAEREEELRTIQRKLVALYVDEIEAGVAIGEFKVEGATVAAFSIIGAVSYVYYWFREDGPDSSRQVAEQVARYCVAPLR